MNQSKNKKSAYLLRKKNCLLILHFSTLKRQFISKALLLFFFYVYGSFSML